MPAFPDAAPGAYMWNIPIKVESASHPDAPVQPNVVLTDHPSGALTFDVLAVPEGVITDYTDPSFSREVVEQAHQDNDPNRGYTPFRIYVQNPPEGIRFDDAGVRALAQFWQAEEAEATWHPTNSPAYVGYADIGNSVREYALGKYSFTVHETGLVMASLQAVANRAGAQRGITAMALGKQPLRYNDDRPGPRQMFDSRRPGPDDTGYLGRRRAEE